MLGNHIELKELGELYSDVDTLLDQLNIHRPDLLFFANEHLDRIGETFMEGVPDLAIESPQSQQRDNRP